jgi:hypothetical protein
MSTDTDPMPTAEERNRLVTTTALLPGSLTRLRDNPGAVVDLLLAGLVVSGVGWLRARSPVPVTEYERFRMAM